MQFLHAKAAAAVHITCLCQFGDDKQQLRALGRALPGLAVRGAKLAEQSLRPHSSLPCGAPLLTWGAGF